MNICEFGFNEVFKFNKNLSVKKFIFTGTDFNQVIWTLLPQEAKRKAWLLRASLRSGSLPSQGVVTVKELNPPHPQRKDLIIKNIFKILS
jgi:hypothetical protein